MSTPPTDTQPEPASGAAAAFPTGQPSSTSCFLFKLPRKLLDRIFLDVPAPYDDTASLARLGRTCRAMHQMTTDLLYRNFKNNPLNFGVNTGHENNFRRNVLLLVTLRSNPSLGSRIRSMQFGPATSELEPSRVPEDVRAAYRAEIRQMFDFFYGTSFANPVTAMALVVKAPNLDRLELTMDATWQDTTFLLKKSTGTNPRFSKPRFTLRSLRDLTVQYYSTGLLRSTPMGVNLDKLDAFFQCAPNLRVLRIFFAVGGSSLNARLPRLSTVKLLNANLCAKGLENLLQPCQRLRCFVYTHCPYRSATTNFTPVPAAAALECLASAKSTLQILHLCTWIPDDGKMAEREDLTCLSSFTALQYVGLDYRALEGPLAELLKGLDNLETIFLYAMEVSVAAFETDFGSFLQAANTQWPRLREIKLSTLRDGEPRRAQDMWNDLVACLARLGVAGGDGVVAGVRVKALPDRK